MTTALSVFFSNQASAVLASAEGLYTTSGAPSVATPKTTIGAATGYGEILSIGSTAAWLGASSLPAPTGKGDLLDSTVLEGQQIPAGAWSNAIRIGLNTSGYSATFEVYVRAYKYNSVTFVYTPILVMSLTGQSFSGSVQSTYALSGTTASATSFATNEKLYIDKWVNIVTTTCVVGQQIRLNSVSTDTTGFTGNTAAMVTSPGYQVNSSTNYTVAITEAIASASAEASLQGAGTNAVTEQIASGTAESSVAGSGSTAITEALGSAYAESGATASSPSTNYTVAITEKIASAYAESSIVGSGNVGMTESLASASAESSLIGSGVNAVTESIASAYAESSATTGLTTAILDVIASASAEASSTQGSTVNITEAIASATAESGFMASTPPVIYTNPTISVTIAGQAVVIRDDNRFELDDAISSISTFLCTVEDLSGTQHFKRGMQITIADSARGTLYTGFVMTSIETAFLPQTYLESQIACVDNHYLVDKRTYTGPEYVNQYAGAILADMLSYLASEGITAQYASLRETTQAQLAAGTRSNVVAATTQGDGDLELASSGTAVAQTENLTTGTLINMANVGSALQLASNLSLKLTGASSQGVAGSGGTTNNYAYVEIWSGSVAIASGDYLSYDVWVSSTSPQITSAVDGICTDGNSLRDIVTPTSMNDQNGLWMHPKTDLSGYANDQWYTRTIVLSNVAGKTLSKVTVAMEGDTSGAYTSYFRTVKLYSSGGSLKQTFYAGGFGTINATVLSNNGYANVACSIATTYQQNGWRISTGTSISSVGIVKSSLMSWQATTPTGTSFINEVSTDSGASWTAATRSQPFPNLLAGVNATGFTILTRQRMSIIGTSPEVTPLLTSQIWSVQPSYNATKTDFLHIEQISTDFSGGTNTNILVPGNNQMSLQGVWRTWDDALTTGQTFSGVGGHGTIAKQGTVTVTGNGNVGVSQLDFAGNWQNFTVEIDMAVSSHGNASFTYRTTNQGTGNNSGAYAVDINPTSLLFGYGANNGASTSQTYHPLGSVAIYLSGTALKVRLKVIVSGSNHRIYIDDVLYFNITDSTYTASGKFGLRFLNSDGVTPGTYTAFFDNFGVMPSLTGSHLVGPLSISGLTTIGNSLVQWDSDSAPNGSVVVESSFDNTTWQTCTNGSPIPGLAAGTANSNTQLYLRTTLTSANAGASAVTGRDGTVYLTPTVHGLTAWATNQINATGNRIGPVLSLGNLGRIGSTLAAWNALVPTGTSLGVDTRVDGGGWSDVTANNGGTVPGLSGQPLATIDQFNVDSHANYTSTYRTGGAVATWAGDSTNDRIVATGGSKALYINNLLTCGDMSMTVDMDYSDTGGWVWHYTSASSFYECVVQDGSAIGGGAPDSIALFSVKSGTRTQLLSVPIIFNRLEKHRFVTTMAGNTITTVLDGVTLWNYSDGLSLFTGKCGLRTDGGTARTYQLYMQPLGDNAYTHTMQMRLRLATTDPTVTPQVLNTTLAAFGNSIGVGALIPQTAYAGNYISTNIDDLATRSNYWWYVDKSKRVSFLPRTAVLAPWIASDNPGDFLYANITMTNQSDLYHNRHIVQNVLQTTPINESRIGDSFTQSWTFSYQWSQAPTITVNGVPAVVGIKGVDTGKQFYYAVGDPTITEDAAQPIYDNTTIITFVGTGQYLTDAVADNLPAQSALAALEASSGIVEKTTDGKGMAYAAGLTFAQSQVAQYGVFGQELQADTRRSGLAPGQLLTVYLSAFNCYGTQFLIRSVKMKIAQEFGGYQPTFSVDAISGPDLSDWAALYKQTGM